MAISIPYAFTANTDILSAQVNANFDALLNALDKRGDTLTGNLTVSAGATIDGVDISAVIGAGGTLLAVNGAAVTSLTAANITAGGTLPALNGSALTSLNASNLSSGTVGTARLGSGTATSGTYLRGDQSWAAIVVTPTVLSKTGAYTVSTSDGDAVVVLADGTFTVTLYAAASNSGKQVTVKNIGTGTITIDANASETIDGALTQVIATTYASLTLLCDGTGWHIL